MSGAFPDCLGWTSTKQEYNALLNDTVTLVILELVTLQSLVKKQVSMIRKYSNHTLQTNLWHHEEEPQNKSNYKTRERQTKQTKQSNQFYLSWENDCKTRKDSYAQQNMKQTQKLTMRETIINESTTTELLP